MLDDVELTKVQVQALEDRIRRVLTGQAVEAEADQSARDFIKSREVIVSGSIGVAF